MAAPMGRAVLLPLIALAAPGVAVGGDAPTVCPAGAGAGAGCPPAGDDVGLLQTRSGRAGVRPLASTVEGPPSAPSSGAARKEDREWGPWPTKPTEPLVHAVYTYGAPATKSQPFVNAASKDGCFPGLRSYTEDMLGAFHEIHQVDAAAMNNYYPHARTASVVLRWGEDSLYTPCNAESDGHPDWPQRGGDVFEEWRIHGEDAYVPRLESLTIDGRQAATEEPFATAHFFSKLAWNSYDTMENTKKALRTNMPGWFLVERADDHYFDNDDPIMVVQDSSSLDCAIVFTGTTSAADLVQSTTQYTTGYCGYNDVHVGYRDALWTLSDHIFKYLKPTLQQCNRLTCVGHSLGGALCELFAACANSGHIHDPDYKKLAWERGQPRSMKEVNDTDTFNN